MYKNILSHTSHRETPIPKGPWVMTQKWNNTLFMHLPASKDLLLSHIPADLELDLYKDQARISILPFKITNMRFRKIPPIPFVHSFLELNVRTYVKRNGIPGIYFFSLDADSLPAVLGARVASLPYYYASMKMKKEQETFSVRTERKVEPKALFEGEYKPISASYYPAKSSLAHWLVERYSLWSYRADSLFRGDIHHKPWEITEVQASISKQEMLPDLPDDLIIGEPLFHFSAAKRVLFWPIKKVD